MDYCEGKMKSVPHLFCPFFSTQYLCSAATSTTYQKKFELAHLLAISFKAFPRFHTRKAFDFNPDLVENMDVSAIVRMAHVIDMKVDELVNKTRR